MLNLNISAGIVACLFVVFVTLLYSIDQPFSFVHTCFHRSSSLIDLADLKNRIRNNVALDYIYSIQDPILTMPESLKEAGMDILVVIVTVSRETDSRSGSPGYLTQAAASMDRMMKQDNVFGTKFMFVCNVDKNPDKHTDASELKHYFPFVDRYGNNSFGINTSYSIELLGSGLKDNARQTEIMDYVFCLKTTLEFKYKYVLVLEDDVIPHSSLWNVLHHTMTHKFSGHYGNPKPHRDFSFLKLYYPQRWQGYAREIVPLLELTCIGTLGGTLFVLIAYLTQPQTSRHQLANEPSPTVTFFYGFLFSVIIVMLVGRVNIMELRRLSPPLYKLGPSSACCSQAMLYRQETVPPLTDHLLNGNTMNKDLAIYEFSRKHGRPGFQLEPNLFWHTGMYSSLSSNVQQAREFLFDVN